MSRFGSSMAAAALLILGLGGCKSSMTAPSAPALPPRVATAPTVLTVNGVAVTLSASAWRDYMPGPGAPVGGSGLMVSSSVTSADATALPSDLTITSVWVVDGSQVWGTRVVENRRDTPEVQVGVTRDGPHWMTGVPVTVVVGIGVESSFERYLRIDSVPIRRTD
jgi:hypothetical protein